MLSKKMALMGLITILALAFVVPSAMAEFGVLMSVADPDADVSAEGGIQVRGDVVVRVKFDKVVVTGTEATSFSASDIEVIAYTDFGGVVTAPTVTEPTDYDANNPDGKNFTITVGASSADVVRVLLYMDKHGVEVADPRADLNDDGIRKADGKSATASLEIHYVGADEGKPRVYSIRRASDPLLPVTAETVNVIIFLSEKPKAFTKDHVDVSNATWGDPVELQTQVADNMSSTGRDGMLYPYVLTITPKYENANDIVVKVKAFEDLVLPISNKYTPPLTEVAYREGISKLTIKVGKKVLTAKTEGFEVVLAKDKIIPNQVGNGVGTPGSAHVIPQADIDTLAIEEKKKSDADTATAAKAEDTSVSIPEDGQIYISEIMFAGGGFLPQWIEISNGSRTAQVNLGGWTLTVENATAGADVLVSAKAKFRIPEGTRIDPSGQHDTPSTLLVVTKRGRTNLDGRMADGQVINLDISRRRYALLSDMAFKITLAPPARPIVTEQAAARAAATDVVGNLFSDAGTATWALPMNEDGGRSSIIRRHVPVSMGPAKPKDGEMLESWVLASDMSLAQPMHLSAHSYYGFPTDVGTPGFRAGGALPVELSQFRSARDKETGTVVITWSTQSELNNAGFFVKRSQQRDGQFQIINATMIPGAGTSSEKQFYAYTDTTAQPNVVYYYQIEDVSLDGNRQTLTRGIRLKGHIGAAGKATTLWGELKRTN